MKLPVPLTIAVASLFGLNAPAEESWQSTRLIPDFYAEGAARDHERLMLHAEQFGSGTRTAARA